MLYDYWKALKDKADCRWGVTTETAFQYLKSHGVSDVLFKPEIVEKYSPDIINKLINQYLSRTRKRTINYLLDRISPDLWLFDTFTRFDPLTKKVPWVHTFHSMCFKKYFFHPMTVDYDLLLLPGEYHKKEMEKRVRLKKDTRLCIIGWPRVDVFFNGGFDRESIMKDVGLNPEAKTVMYAPTCLDEFGHQGLFPRWFGRDEEVLELICSEMKKMGVNFIIKLHANAIKALKNKRLFDIAKRYNVLWPARNTDYCTVDPNPFLWITDVLISDVSGSITDYMVLNRPVVFIDPDDSLGIWEECDIPRELRTGHVVTEVRELVIAVEDSLKAPDRFRAEREEFLSRMFCKLDGKASERAGDAILEFAADRGIK